MKKFLLKTSVVFIITFGIFSLSSCKDKFTYSENDSEEEVSTE